MTKHDVYFIPNPELCFTHLDRNFEGPDGEDFLYFSFRSKLDDKLRGSVELAGYKYEGRDVRAYEHSHRMVIRINIEVECRYYNADFTEDKTEKLRWVVERDNEDRKCVKVFRAVYHLTSKYRRYPIWMTQRSALCFLWAAGQPELSFLAPEIALKNS